jgi:hypothetical protein
MKNEKLFDLVNCLVEQNTGFDIALSVLREAVEYFEQNIEPGSFEANYLLMRQDHICNLFCAAERMLHDLGKQYNEITDALHEKL